MGNFAFLLALIRTKPEIRQMGKPNCFKIRKPRKMLYSNKPTLVKVIRMNEMALSWK